MSEQPHRVSVPYQVVVQSMHIIESDRGDANDMAIALRAALARDAHRATLSAPASPLQTAHPLDALLPEICQLIDGCKLDWEAQGCWSEWDQSVRDRISAYNSRGRSN